MRDDDLRTELEFHIAMRTQRHINAGMAPDGAEALARKQFGDVEAAMRGMRLARMRSPKMTLIAVTFTSLTIAAVWLFAMMAPTEPIVLPSLPSVPLQLEVQKRPPPPPPGPTWEEFVAKVNTFGDGKSAKRAPR
jgi:hypothetical protein